MSDGSHRVVFTDVPPDPATDAMLISAGIDVHYLSGTDTDTLRREAAKATALVNGFTILGDEQFDAMPELRLVCLTSMGSDMVQLDAALRRGITVTRIPGDTSTIEVATHAFALMLDIVKGITRGARDVAAGAWARHREVARPRLSELRVGLLGFGNIGRAFAAEFGGHFAEILAFDPFPPETLPPGVRLVSRDELLRSADIVSLHLPLLPETRRTIDAVTLGAMKPGAVLVNVSRGGLVDEAALAEALDSGHISAAALDVLTDEPPQDGNPLVGHPRVTVTPHIAYLSTFTEREYREVPARNVISFTAGRPLQGLLSPAPHCMTSHPSEGLNS